MKRNKEMENERNEEGKRKTPEKCKILNPKHQTKYQLNKKRNQTEKNLKN